MKGLLIALTLALLTGCGKLDYFEGPMGPEGRPGSPGADGSGCTAEQTENGSIITCANGSTAVILNGVDGEDGEDAEQSAYAVVGVIKPCPGSGYREVILKLSNGELLAHYSDGGNRQFLTLLTPGTYKLTDGSQCVFTVNQDMTVVW